MKRKADELSDDEVVPEKSRSLYTNKQRVLILASRGITARYRHLQEDLKLLIPHHKKDSKLDSKGDIKAVMEIAEFKSCNQIMYLECRKHQGMIHYTIIYSTCYYEYYLYEYQFGSRYSIMLFIIDYVLLLCYTFFTFYNKYLLIFSSYIDLYMYLGNTPMGPSVKFHVVNIHTMDELKLTGNCMKGSRPLLNFDAAFDSKPHWQVLKHLLSETFNTPKGHPKSKPFIDHVLSFFIVKNNIWIRNYQIVEKSERGDGKENHLIEIGPRKSL
jgi:ribosome biogenesis protein BRX1